MLSWYKSAGPNFTGRQIVLNNKKKIYNNH